MAERRTIRLDSNEIVPANSTLVGLSIGLNRDLETVEIHTRQIESLKKEIEEKDEAILKLKKEVKDLRDQNDDLKITLKSRERELKALKDKISKLETEKEALEKKLKSVELEMEVMKRDVAELKEEVADLKEAEDKNEEKNEKLKKRIKGLTENLEEKGQESANLKKEVRTLRESVQFMGTERMALPTVGADPVESASLVLGQMCSQVQSMMYQKVLPDLYQGERPYKVSYIEEDINGMKDKQSKDEARRRWDDLKRKLNWKEKLYPRAMKWIQTERNITAHPSDLNKEKLVKSAKVMKESGKLTGWQSFSCVNELIEIWKRLTEMA